MQKTAQKRSVLNKLREMTNVSGKAAEKFFNPKFKEVMDTIRKKDDQIRTYVIGKRLGEAENDAGGLPLKDSLKQAKSNLNRREFLTAATDLGQFHDQIRKVVAEINSIEYKVDQVHHEFLFDKLTPEQQEQLSGFKERFAQHKNNLTKEAGIMDFFHNIGTARGRALAAWEKRYPNEVNKFKNGIGSLISKSDNMLEVIIDALKEMAAARSVRHIDDYLKGTAKIIKAYQNYENGKGGFREFYNTTLKNYIDKMEEYKQQAVPVAENPAPAQLGNTNIPVQSPTSPLSMPSSPSVQKTMLPPPPTNLDPASKAPNTIPSPPPSMSEHDADNGPETLRSAHKNFFNSLQTLSGESPLMLALFIKKYANSIAKSDKSTAVKLFKIAQRIKE